MHTIQTARVKVAGGEIHVRTVGQGPTLLFVHALLVNSHVWDALIPRLASHYTLVMPDLALGAHHYPLEQDADCSLQAHAERIVELARALGGEITLIGNDTGGAIAQLAVLTAPDVFSRLVLLPCDAFDNCPPKAISSVRHLPKIPGALALATAALRSPWIAKSLMTSVVATPLSSAELDTLLGGLRRDPMIRRDLGKVLVNLSPSVTSAAAARLHTYPRPVGLLWSRDDALFPVEHAQRLAALFPDSRLELIDGSRTLMAIDAPDAVAEFICDFVPSDITSAARSATS